jgi:hypothetical protein
MHLYFGGSPVHGRIIRLTAIGDVPFAGSQIVMINLDPLKFGGKSQAEMERYNFVFGKEPHGLVNCRIISD